MLISNVREVLVVLLLGVTRIIIVCTYTKYYYSKFRSCTTSTRFVLQCPVSTTTSTLVGTEASDLMADYIHGNIEYYYLVVLLLVHLTYLFFENPRHLPYKFP